LKDGRQEVSTLDLKQSGVDVTGTLTSSNDQAADIKDGRLIDQALTFSFAYMGRQLEVSGQVLSDSKIDLTIIAKAMNETFHAVAERKETPVAGGQPLNALPLLPLRTTRRPLIAENGFNDAAHAGQRMAAQLSAVAIRNLAAEFQPQWALL
jgi:hypothetical protein